jgi:carboxyl-terminal processing protease
MFCAIINRSKLFLKRELYVTSHATLPTKKQLKQGKTTRILAAILAGVIIFGVGINVGNGRLSFNHQKAVSGNLPDNLDYATVEAIYDKLRIEYDGKLDQTALMDGLKQGLAQATGDPYTEYFNTKDAKSFDDELNGSFTGIGAELGKNAQDNIEVIAPIAGFPAEKAGLKSKDVIAEVDGESTAGKTVSQVVDKVRGPADTHVKLKVIRSNSQALDFDIVRTTINIPSVKDEITADNIGILTISRFGPDTATLARTAAEKFKAANVKGIVLDLRGDPGGLLDAAESVSSMWLDPSQTVLLEKRDDVVVKTYRAEGNPILKGIKTAVLIDGGSASASEITAGALRDNKAATLIGVKSYGKGSVQQLLRLSDGGMLKVTSAHWFTPSGKGISKIGIEPDQKIERTDADFKNNVDPQKTAAIEFVKK